MASVDMLRASVRRLIGLLSLLACFDTHSYTTLGMVSEPRLLDCLRVESLEEGERGFTEIVYPHQIIRKEIGYS